MYGCERYGYDGMEELCTDSNALGWMGAMFFVIFTVLGRDQHNTTQHNTTQQTDRAI